MSTDLTKAARKLMERLGAYRSEADWPQCMREAIAELKAEIAKVSA